MDILVSEAVASSQPPEIYDGFSALDGGMDGRANRSVASPGNPNGLARNQVSLAVNSTFRDGEWTHRPPYMRRELSFPTYEQAAAFTTGLMQGYAVHEATQSSLIVSVAGRIYQIAVENGFTVRDITPATGPHPSNQDWAWFLQAGPFSVIQDGTSKPFIFDGTSVRESRPNEIKPGGPMAFSQGRIWYAVKDVYGRFTRFRATDLIGLTDEGTSQYQYQDSVLLENENTFLNEGGDFTSRSDMGEIRAMIVPRMLDTSLGQGPLQIFCERGALSGNAPIDRTQWKNVTYPIITESVLDYGALGACFASNANGDILYRSLDGIRSFKLSRADFQQWLNTGISSEVDSIIAGDPQAYLFYGSSLVFDNRYLATTWPRPTSTGFVHDGLVALDFNLISSLRQRRPAAWEGVWTGVAFYRLVKGVFGKTERCFAFGRNKDGHTELWEILESDTDEIWDNGDTPIVWSAETPNYDYNNAQNRKRLDTAAIWRHDIQETVSFLYQWKPDNYPCFIDWHMETDCAPIKQCTLPRCSQPKNLRPQYRPKVRLPQAPDDCDPINKSLFRDFYEMSGRIQITGHCRIKTVRYAAHDLFEPLFDGCPIAQSCNPLDCCSPDPILYSSAPYHNWGSDSGYPAPVYPDYPPAIPTCDDCNVVNPPPDSGGVVTPGNPDPPAFPPNPPQPPATVLFPGLPPVILLPDPDLPPLVGASLFHGAWYDPSPGPFGTGFEIGNQTPPPSGLQSGTLDAWATQLWQQFSDWVVQNAIPVSQAQISIEDQGPNIGPPSALHYFADTLIQSGVYVSSYGLRYVLIIEYLN